MIEKNIALARFYYEAMDNKDLVSFHKFLHQDVRLISPFGVTQTKEAVLVSIQKFFDVFDTLTIDGAFGAGNQTVIIYDVHCPAPIGTIRAASYMTFKDGLIETIELLYDTQPFYRTK